MTRAEAELASATQGSTESRQLASRAEALAAENAELRAELAAGSQVIGWLVQRLELRQFRAKLCAVDCFWMLDRGYASSEHSVALENNKQLRMHLKVGYV